LGGEKIGGSRKKERQGDWETRRLGDKETGRQGDWETRRLGDKETGRHWETWRDKKIVMSELLNRDDDAKRLAA
jgi:hypothetical protein